MAVISLLSTRGAPGVTTTTLGLCLVWPRPAVLIEADVSGSSSIGGGYLQGATPPGHGLINLAVAHRSGTLSAATIREQAQPLTRDGTRRAVLALHNATQISGLTTTFWEQLGQVLRDVSAAGMDVIVDAGRVGAAGWPAPVIHRSDAVLVAMRTNLDAVVSVHANVSRLRALTEESPVATDGLRLMLIGEGRPYRAKQTSTTIGLPVAATVAFDPTNADALSRGLTRGRRFATSPLVRSLRSAADEIGRLAERASAQLAHPDGQAEAQAPDPDEAPTGGR